MSNATEIQVASQFAAQITAEGSRVCCWRATGKNAGKYNQVYAGGVYEAVRRKSDGMLTWRMVDEFGGTRSGKCAPSAKFVEELKAAAEYPWQMVRHGDACK